MLWRDVVVAGNGRSEDLCFGIFDSGIQVRLAFLQAHPVSS